MSNTPDWSSLCDEINIVQEETPFVFLYLGSEPDPQAGRQAGRNSYISNSLLQLKVLTLKNKRQIKDVKVLMLITKAAEPGENVPNKNTFVVLFSKHTHTMARVGVVLLFLWWRLILPCYTRVVHGMLILKIYYPGSINTQPSYFLLKAHGEILGLTEKPCIGIKKEG